MGLKFPGSELSGSRWHVFVCLFVCCCCHCCCLVCRVVTSITNSFCCIWTDVWFITCVECSVWLKFVVTEISYVFITRVVLLREFCRVIDETCSRSYSAPTSLLAVTLCYSVVGPRAFIILSLLKKTVNILIKMRFLIFYISPAISWAVYCVPRWCLVFLTLVYDFLVPLN